VSVQVSNGPADRGIHHSQSMSFLTRIFSRLYHAKLTSQSRTGSTASPEPTSQLYFFGPSKTGPSKSDLSGESSFEWLHATGKAASDLPVIVFFHGGAWVASDRDDPGRVHRRFLSSLAARGFDCINANYRRLGCGATKLADCMDDVASVLEFIVTHNIANASVRGVVLVGHSTGSHLILQTQMAGHLNRFQSHLRGIYSIGGVYDLVDFRKRCSTFLKLFAMRQFAKLSDEELLRLSPRHTRFPGTCCPVRLLHGEQEGFLLVQAQEYLLALQAQKFRASLRVFSGHNHFSLLRPNDGSEGVLGAHDSVNADLADFAAECSHSYVKLRNSRAAQS